jgi:hypothetical protein
LPSDTITQFWFPTMVAALRTAWGGYGYALWAVFGLAMFGAAAIGMIPRKEPEDDVGIPRPKKERPASA